MDPGFPAVTDSYLVVLGVGARVGREELAAALRERSRRWHPDRFALAEPQVREAAQFAAAAANDAYRTLLNPVDRASYLLLRHRGTRPDRLKQSVSPDVLAQMLDLQECVEEAREAGDPVAAQSRLVPWETDLLERMESLHRELDTAFADYDAGHVEEALNRIEPVLALHGYLRRGLELVRSVIGAH